MHRQSDKEQGKAANLGQTFSRKRATASEVSRFSLSCSLRLRASYCVDPGTACTSMAKTCWETVWTALTSWQCDTMMQINQVIYDFWSALNVSAMKAAAVHHAVHSNWALSVIASVETVCVVALNARTVRDSTKCC